MKKIILQLCMVLFSATTMQAQDLVPFYSGDAYGYKDKSGKEIIAPKYKHADEFKDGLARVSNEKNKDGFIDGTGKEIIPLKYDYASEFSEGLSLVRLNEKHGYIDKTGKVIIPLKYQKAGDFDGGIARVKLNDKYGFIDQTEKEIIPLKYDEAEDFFEGLAMVKLIDKYGFIDRTGAVVVPITYERAGNFHEGLAKVKLNQKYGFIDITGKVIIDFEYYGANDFSEGLAGVSNGGSFSGGKYGFVDKTGKLVIPFDYDEVSYYGFHNGKIEVKQITRKFYINYWGEEVDYKYKVTTVGYSPKADLSSVIKIGTPRNGMQLARDKSNMKYGYLNEKDVIVLPFVYESATLFGNNRAPVTLNGKSIYIDKTGKEVINAEKYSYTQNFSDGYAVVKNAQKMCAFIDTTGKLMTDFVYSSADGFGSGLAAVCKENKYGFIGIDFKPSIPLIYKYVDYFSETGLAHVVTMQGKHGYINRKGEFVIPAIYDDASRDWNLISNNPGSGWPYHTYMVNLGTEKKYFNETGKEVVMANPFEVAKFVKSGSLKDLLSYSEKCGNTYTSSSNGGNIEYKVSGNFNHGIEKFIDLQCGGIVVKYKFNSIKEKIEYSNNLTEKAKFTSFNQEMAYKDNLQEKGYINKSASAIAYAKDGATIVMNPLDESWIIGTIQSPTQAKPSAEVKTKTHTLKVYPCWADLFEKTEEVTETLSSSFNKTGKNPSDIFSGAPDGWLKNELTSDRLNIRFSEYESTIAKEKQDFINLSSSRSGLTKDKIKLVEEPVTLADGRRGVILFYYTPDSKGNVGYYLDCKLLTVSDRNPKMVTNYTFFMEGNANGALLEKDFIGWKDYLKKVLLTIKPIK